MAIRSPVAEAKANVEGARGILHEPVFPDVVLLWHALRLLIVSVANLVEYCEELEKHGS